MRITRKMMSSMWASHAVKDATRYSHRLCAGKSGNPLRLPKLSARIAAALVERSKDELVTLWRDTSNDEGLFQTMDALQEAGEVMKSLAAMIETAHLRMLIAVHAYAAEIGGDTWAQVAS
jgi:hypothetical protein